MRRIAALLGSLAIVVVAGCHRAPPPGPCVGDCDGDGAVTVADFVCLTGIDLGYLSFDACKVLDANGDGQFSKAERVEMVRNYSDGCGHVRTADDSE